MEDRDLLQVGDKILYKGYEGVITWINGPRTACDIELNSKFCTDLDKVKFADPLDKANRRLDELERKFKKAFDGR